MNNFYDIERLIQSLLQDLRVEHEREVSELKVRIAELNQLIKVHCDKADKILGVK